MSKEVRLVESCCLIDHITQRNSKKPERKKGKSETMSDGKIGLILFISGCFSMGILRAIAVNRKN